MKKSFWAGLVILLPLALTVTVGLYLFNLLTGPFVGFVHPLLDRLFGEWRFPLPKEQTVRFVSQVLVLFSLLLFTILLGAVTRLLFGRALLQLGESILQRVPFVRWIYRSSKEVIVSIFKQDAPSFSQVVLVPYPSVRSYAIGLVTQENMQDERIAVFIPTTPNPTSGFMVLYPPKEVIRLDMPVEDALKYVISCGVVVSPFEVKDRSGTLLTLRGMQG